MIRPDISARRIGQEAQPIAIIDGFHSDPDALRVAAAGAALEAGLNHYPGIRAALPGDYFDRVRPALIMALKGAFGLAGEVALIDASFSIVTHPPALLTVQQRLPHMDAVDLNRVALVHYLSPDGGDGTAFFRHRATGYETIDSTRSQRYFRTLNAELQQGGAPLARYVADSTPLFERIAHVEARYNRAVLYRSALLHSGAIAPDAVLSDDPERGRLTVTAFLSLG